MSLTIIAMGLDSKKINALNARRKQSEQFIKENALRDKFEKYTKEKVGFSKRYKVETMCLQAGINLSYSDFLLLSYATSIIMAIVMASILNNIILGLLFLLIGYITPRQVVGFLKNKRLGKLNLQVGSFMQMVIKRYENTKDFNTALELTLHEFKGQQPIYGEIRKTVTEINLGLPVTEAMDNMARRTGNKYMQRLSDYYKIASNLGTEEVRKNLLRQAHIQYEENRRTELAMKKEIAKPVREAYIMLATIPAFAVYMITTNDDYVRFMTQEFLGKVGVAVISFVFIGCVWFINTKLGAPLDQ